jgi:hypothetical protein
MTIVKHLIIWAICLFALGETGVHVMHSIAIVIWLAGGILTGAYAQVRLEKRRALAHAHRVYQDEQIREQARDDLLNN